MTTDKKAQAIELMNKGETPSKVAEQLGVSKPTVYAWKKEMEPSKPNSIGLDYDLMKTENEYLKKQLELYKREVARLQA